MWFNFCKNYLNK